MLFRTESGQVHVMDAYCQHLGANLGVGGTVEGENIVCPWHGWRWRGDGTNALIPYSKIGCKNNVRIRTYPSVEWYGFILAWHRASRPGAVLAAAGAAGAGNRRVLPAAPAHPDAQPGQGTPADDHRERRRPLPRSDTCTRPPIPPPPHRSRYPDADLHATVNAISAAGVRRPGDPERSGRRQDHLRQTTRWDWDWFASRASLATVQVTGQTPVDEDYTDYFYTQASIREPGDDGDVLHRSRRQVPRAAARGHQDRTSSLGRT